MDLLSHSSRLLTHQSPNSQAAVQFEIRKMERIHWYLGLRQAELIIEDKTEVLRTTEYKRRQAVRQVQKQKRQIARLRAFQRWGWGLINPALRDQIAEAEDDLNEATHHWQKIDPYIRDCQMEQTTAMVERDRIIQEHRSDLNTSFIELQNRYSQVALLGVHTRYVASRKWAFDNAMPEGVGELLFQLAPEEREQILSREIQLRGGVDSSAAIAWAGNLLADLPEEQRRQVLLQAAKTVLSQQTSDQPAITFNHEQG